jgi:DNA-binding transcriptional MerR regulator
MKRGKYTTAEAAKKAGIHQVTLQRWIKSGKVKAPVPTLVGAVGYRLWSDEDISRLKQVKQIAYHKGSGRKKKGNSK